MNPADQSSSKMFHEKKVKLIKETLHITSAS